MSLYIHVPFCASRCTYCDFYSTVAGPGETELMEAVARATLFRARGLAERFGATSFQTAYVGGGTPSRLPRVTLKRLLVGLAAMVESGAEWTVEANPESVDEDFLDILDGEGVNRLSLGVQTFDDSRLGELGRGSDASRTLSAIRRAAKRGINLSADLIAGFSRVGGLAEEARILAEEGCGHISIYDLTLEEGTALERRWRDGLFEIQDQDEAADEREAVESLLSHRGFKRYEVSNYCIPGKESAHNLAYWRMTSWIGAGPGASGTVGLGSRGRAAMPGIDGGSLRIDETRSLHAYAEGKAEASAEETVLAPRLSAFESLMMGFRTSEGIDCQDFEERFGLRPESLIGKSLSKWAARLGADDNRLFLDGKGLDLLNAFLSDCLEELEFSFPQAPSRE